MDKITYAEELAGELEKLVESKGSGLGAREKQFFRVLIGILKEDNLSWALSYLRHLKDKTRDSDSAKFLDFVDKILPVVEKIQRKEQEVSALASKIERVWNVYTFPPLVEEIKMLSYSQKSIVNELVDIFLRDVKFFWALATKPHASREDTTMGRIDHCSFKVKDDLSITLNQLIVIGEEINTMYSDSIQPILIPRGFPFESHNKIRIVPFPRDPRYAIIKWQFFTEGTFYEGRGTGNTYAIILNSNSDLIKFLTSGESAGLFFHVVRNSAILIDPFAAVYFDATYAGKQGALFVIDLRPQKFALWVWNSVKGTTPDFVKTFSDEQEFYDICAGYNELKPKRDQKLGGDDNIFSGIWGEVSREKRVYDFNRVKRILEGGS